MDIAIIGSRAMASASANCIWCGKQWKAIKTVSTTYPEDNFCLRDRFATVNGMRLTEVDVAAGHATAVMTVEDRHLNSLDIVHGGVYFALADLACGASVGYAENGAVTLDATGEFMASARLGDTITAVAQRTTETRRIVRIQVVLRNQDDVELCVFRFTNYKKRR